MADNTTLTAYLSDHPKMTGVLFTLLMFLTQVGSVAAKNSGFYSGP
jgi:hypothetical protein